MRRPTLPLPLPFCTLEVLRARDGVVDDRLLLPFATTWCNSREAERSQNGLQQLSASLYARRSFVSRYIRVGEIIMDSNMISVRAERSVQPGSRDEGSRGGEEREVFPYPLFPPSVVSRAVNVWQSRRK